MPNLAIENLTLSHFRSHHQVQIQCDARPIAVYGSNGVGKTNILEAISVLSPGRGIRGSSAEEMSRRPESLGWKVKAVVHSQDRRHEVETWSENGAARRVRIDEKSATQIMLGRITRILWLVPAMDRLWIEGAEGRRRFLDRMTLSFQPSHAENVLIYEKAMRERNRLLKDQVKDPLWYRAIEEQMALSGVKIRAARTEALKHIQAAQEEAKTVFPTAKLSLVNSEDVVIPTESSELAQMLNENRSRDTVAGRTLIGPHRDDIYGVFAAKNVPAKDSSTGEQKALLISLILANARALKQQTGHAPILLLDEVAAHLDQERRASLYNEICTLGAQAWMTGTGPELFLELGNAAQHLLVAEVEGKSQVKFL